jgi:ribosomal protein S18 acetylase RimI-like enzyme
MNTATAQDCGAIMATIQRCTSRLLAEGIHQWDDVYPTLAGLERDADARGLYWLQEQGVCVASIGFDAVQPREYAGLAWHLDDAQPLVVHRLCVHPDWQGRGLAKHCLDFVLSRARQQSMVEKQFSVRLDTHSENQIALAVFRKAGFKVVDQCYFPRRAVPFLCMELDLLG